MEPTAAGALSKTPLAHLFVYCVDKKLTGTLVLRPADAVDDSASDMVTLVEGLPSKIKVSDPIEHLGRILLEIGAIDDATYNASLMQLGKGGALHGQILLAAKKIDAATLERALRLQLRRKLGHLFERPTSTTYAYYERVDLLQKYGGPERYPTSVLPVLWTGIRSHPSMAHVDATLDRVTGMPLRLRADNAIASFELSRGERELCERIRVTPMSVAQLQESGIVDGRTTRLLVYTLLVAKQIEPVAVQAPVQARASFPAADSIAPPRPATDAMPSQPMPSQPTPSRPVPSSPVSMPAPSRGGVSDVVGRGTPVSPPLPKTGDPERRAQIVAKAAALTKETHFEILGLKQDSTADEAKAAYFQLAKRWHPDRLPADLADLKSDVASVFAAMAESYQALTDPEKRKAYLDRMKDGGGTVAENAEVQRILEATNAFQRGVFYLDKSNFAESEVHLARALELDPSEPDYIAAWAWYQANTTDRKEAGRYDDLVVKLDKVLETTPKCERARFYRAMMFKLSGRMGDAIRDFREIAEQNPRHTEAVREVRLYAMRSDRDRKTKDEGSGSLLGKFIKKK